MDASGMDNSIVASSIVNTVCLPKDMVIAKGIEDLPTPNYMARYLVSI